MKALPSIFRSLLVPLLCLTLSACVANAPPVVEPRIAVSDRPEYVCLDGCNKPAWVDSIPDDANGNHYFVGLTGYHATEKEARDEALANARKDYATYTGVEVQSLDEVVRASFGQASQVIDATVSGRSHEKQTTDANVSRFKGQKYHSLRLEERRHGKLVGYAYQAYALATVPVDEIERVRQWKREKEEYAAATQSERRAGMRQALQRFDIALADGNALTALNYWRSAEELANAGETAELKSALQRWGQAIVIDVGRFSTLCVVGPAGKGCPLPVWVRCQGKTVAQLAIRLRNGAGEVVARAVTAVDGRAELLVPPAAKGALRVELDPDVGLPPVAAQINVLRADDYGEHLQAAVMALFGGPQGEALSVASVTLGPVSYQNGPGTGEFARSLKGELRQALTAIPGLSLRDPQPRTVATVTSAVTRGISLSGNKRLSAGTSTVQAALDGADAALDVDYRLQGQDVVLTLSLVRAFSDEVLRTANVTLPAAILPPGIPLLPSLAQPAIAGSSGAIRLDVAPHLGDGQVYAEGEMIRYFLSADRDCQLLLIYQDAAGQLIQIFPNEMNRNAAFRSGSFVEFPRKNDPFEFAVTPPFGIERVYAFSTMRPFPQLPGEERGGLRFLKGPLNTIIRTLRDFGHGQGLEYGESVTTIVTAASK